MKIIICNSRKEVVKEGASLVVSKIKEKKNLILGLATGETMAGFYKELISSYKNGKVSFSKVRTFNLDEYVGLSSSNRSSCKYFMYKNFFSKVDISKENIGFLLGDAGDLKKECLRYEREIKKVGGIDLQILGIGKNGHIGFNEPSSSLRSRTHIADLSMETRLANARFFDGFVGLVPRQALTVGIGTIMNVKKIILLAFGKDKARVVFRALKGEISKDVPASALQKHKNVIFILDISAASELNP